MYDVSDSDHIISVSKSKYALNIADYFDIGRITLCAYIITRLWDRSSGIQGTRHN